MSSSRKGTSVSSPVAVDVIGLGDLIDSMDDCGLPFSDGPVMLAARRLDLALVGRIELALRAATEERSWCRQGWMVILANRWTAMGVSGVREYLAAVCRHWFSPFRPALIQLRHVDTDVEQSPCGQEKGAASERGDTKTNSDAHTLDNLSSGHLVVEKRSRTVRSVRMVARAATGPQGQTRGDNGTQTNMTVPLAELEVGVFRSVVMFVLLLRINFYASPRE